MKRLEKIMQKEMTRKEFLGALGVGIVSVVGMGSIARLIFGKSSTEQRGNTTASTYGSASYGGPKTT